jgi:DNA-binding NtrC family response regulator
VLVVNGQQAELSRIVGILEAAGYQASAADTFEDGRRLLASLEPLVLITSVKLGSHNGLHLVLRAKLSKPELSAIVTHHVRDTVLEAEAHRQDATFLVQPCSTGELCSAVKAGADNAWRARHDGRKS